MASAQARRAAAVLRDRARTNRAATRHRRAVLIAARRVRTAPRSLTTHVIATGAAPEHIAGAVTALRKKAKEAGIKGTAARIRRTASGRLRRATTGYRYTREQVAQIVAAYKPRKAEYKVVRAALLRAVTLAA